MRRITFDLDVLRTFVTGIDMGSFAKAAERLGRSTSAVSAQLKKLEDQVGTAVLRKEGRGMVTTTAGELLLGYARRLLELNDQAATAVRGAELAGSVRFGMAQDFGEPILTEVLGRFARVHPRVHVEARVARNGELMEELCSGGLDLALAWDGGGTTAHALDVARLPLRWIGAATGGTGRPWQVGETREPLPLVSMDAPCLMRNAGTAALDRAGIPWRIAFTSPSLGGVWAAVAAGLGVTVRTGMALPPSLRVLEGSELPRLPAVGLRLHRGAAQLPAPAQRLQEILLDAIATHLPREEACVRN